jgi:hypothetical protein
VFGEFRVGSTAIGDEAIATIAVHEWPSVLVKVACLLLPSKNAVVFCLLGGYLNELMAIHIIMYKA